MLTSAGYAGTTVAGLKLNTPADGLLTDKLLTCVLALPFMQEVYCGKKHELGNAIDVPVSSTA